MWSAKAQQLARTALSDSVSLSSYLTNTLIASIIRGDAGRGRPRTILLRARQVTLGIFYIFGCLSMKSITALIPPSAIIWSRYWLEFMDMLTITVRALSACSKLAVLSISIIRGMAPLSTMGWQ